MALETINRNVSIDDLESIKQILQEIKIDMKNEKRKAKYLFK